MKYRIGNIKIKCEVTISKKKDRGITESLTKRKDWLRLKKGDWVMSRKSGIKRKIISTNSRGSIVLNKIRGIGTTVYADCDRGWFIPIIKYQE